MIRNVVIPILWTILLGVIFGVALWFSIPAKADTPTAEQYAATHGSVICDYLDRMPAPSYVEGLLQRVQLGSGMSLDDSVEAVVLSTVAMCPWNMPLLKAFAYGTQGQVV